MTAAPLLAATDLSSGYGRIPVIHDLSLEVRPGSILAVVGANGAGKTTLANTLAGFTKVLGGEIQYRGQDYTRVASYRRVRDGMALVAEGRHLFGELSVRENLELALLAQSDVTADRHEELMDREYQRFAVLGRRQEQLAGTLSGGEQQMLAISRALILQPELLILDEPSTGLAPQIRKQIFDTIEDVVAETGCGCVLIEQRALEALKVASTAIVLERGAVVRDAPADELLESEDLNRLFLGGSST